MAKMKSKTTSARTLEVMVDKDGTRERALAKVAAAALAGNALTVADFGKATLGELHLSELVRALEVQAGAVNGGDLAAAEAMLSAQAVSLNAIYAELARRAALNMGEYLGATETYLRLALKAQAQCARTFEVLATIKAGPTIIARQANIAHGPQQVNNSVNGTGRAGAHAHGKSGNGPTGLLGVSNGERLDTGTTSAAGRTDPPLATMDRLHRAEDRRR